MEIVELLAFTQKNDASDLHLSSNHPPTLRVNGEMYPLNIPAISAEDMKRLLYSVMTQEQQKDFELELELDFAINFDGKSRFRANAFMGINGPAAVLRNIPSSITTLDQLKMPEIVKKLTYLQKGLVLVTGPTGSGKSTTLAAMVHHINQNMNKHILTIEDPIEFIHKSDKSLINQREIGTHTTSFARALKSALREDPDIILVGELRDLETIQLALTAAETGHLILATLHTSSAAQTINRMIDVFPPHAKGVIRTMISGSLEAVISQTLLKQKDGKGRVAAHEILIATSAIRNLIRDDKIPQIHSLIQVGTKAGMKTMKDSVFELVERGVITSDTAKMAINTGLGGLESAGTNNFLANEEGLPGTF